MEIGKELATALLGFQSEVPDIKKTADNPFFKSKYAPLDEIIPAIRPVLKKYGLVVIQIPHGSDELTTIITHAPSGQSVSGTIKMTPKDASPQGHGSAITYSKRYALVPMLMLNTEGDDDGNAASAPGRAPAAVPRPMPTAPPAQADIPAPKPGCITVPQGRRLVAIAKNAGKTNEEIKQFLLGIGIERLSDMPRAIYEDSIRWAEGKPAAAPVNGEEPPEHDEPPF